MDPNTQILCLGFRLPNWKKGRTGLWHPAFDYLGLPESGVDDLVDLFNWIIAGERLESHNRWFDYGIWKNIAVPRFGWPDVEPSAWLCSAAKAASHALPRGLDDAAAALGLSVRKDAAGSKTMMKLNKPRKPRKAEVAAWQKVHGNAPMPVLYHESKEMFETLFAYCRQDVLAEEAVSAAIPNLSPAEEELYLLDQTINERGFLLDMEAVSVALELIEQETTRLNGELKILTGGSPDKASQRKKMHDWFLDQWVVIEDTKAGSIDEALKRTDISPRVRRGLELLQALGRSSTAKYEAMRNWACGDGRVRGGLLYHGASTGRWSGAGVQPHNFPRGSVKDIDAAWRVLKSRDRARIEGFNVKGKKVA
jgi:DNA polymerase bacteriophage-type